MICITYNIHNGGDGQIEAIARMLASFLPDILVLQEAKALQSDLVLLEFSKQSGLTNVYEAPKDTNGLGTMILSRYKILQVENQNSTTHPSPNVVLKSNIGDISVAGVHLDSSDESVRLGELSAIIKAQEASVYRIIMGDFNALSPSDKYNWDKTSQPVDTTTSFAADKPEFDAIQSVEAAGYKDTAVLMNQNSSPTVPFTVDGQIRFTDLRLDYTFISESLCKKLTKYYVIDTDQTRKYSDHLPVLVELG